VAKSEKTTDETENLEPTMNFFDEEGTQLVKELEKTYLSKGAWSTIMYKYQDLNKATGEFGPEKASVRRYQKQNGEYKFRSKFNISSAAQARTLAGILMEWFPEESA
jgi:hypothetical protein